MDFWGYCCFLIVCLYGVACQGPPSYSTGLETQLRSTLFAGYEMQQRPSRRVPVNIALNMLSIAYLDIKEQKLSFSAYFTFTWLDSRLKWDTNVNYTDIIFLFSSERFMWKPSILLENSVNDMEIISKPQVPMRIIKNSRVTWTPGGVFTTHCQSDITYYPLDTQTCHIKLSTVGYTITEIDLAFISPNEYIMDSFQENGEWEIISKSSSSSTETRERESFRRLTFTIKFRRRPIFHMLNTLFPVVLMGFLTVVVFKLPPESGERVGLSLTILLAYAVYLTLISENIPQTSVSASLLSAYLASILLLQTVSVLLTVIYLDIYFTPDTKPVPGWLQSFARSFLAKLTCIECGKPSRATSPETGARNGVIANGHTLQEIEMDSNSTNGNKATLQHGQITERSTGNEDSVPVNVFERPISAQKAWSDSCEKETVYSWQEIASMLDKVTMYLYLVLITTVTFVCLGLIAGHHSAG